jgi:hypothetical protein
VAKLTENFDLIAIAVLALLLGAGESHKPYIRNWGLELRRPDVRILHIEPLVRALPVSLLRNSEKPCQF